MKRSIDRILITHTGSLARPEELKGMLLAKDRGEPVDAREFDVTVQRAVVDIVKKQAEIGLSIINDGEQSKIGFAPYVDDRLHGFDGPRLPRPLTTETREFPEYIEQRVGAPTMRPACNGPLSWKDFSIVEKDIANLKATLQVIQVDEEFMTACSPGMIANFHPNQYYPTREAYLQAMADVMKREYDAIVNAGFILQVDSPDLALHHNWFPDLSVQEFRREAALNVEALNYAIRDVDAERVRMHVCWGALEGPHNHDVELKDIIDILLKARPAALSIVGANGRHEHEWRVSKDVKLPEGKMLIPGVIDSTTNIVEHPELVAERLVRWANLLGRENVIGGVDCGFGTNVRVGRSRLTRKSPGRSSRHLWTEPPSRARTCGAGARPSRQRRNRPGWTGIHGTYGKQSVAVENTQCGRVAPRSCAPARY